MINVKECNDHPFLHITQLFPPLLGGDHLNGIEVRLSISARKLDHMGLEDTLLFLVYSGPHGEVGC